MKASLAAARQALRSPMFLRELHNRMALYTVVMLGIATGYRSVRDPLNDPRHFDIPSRRAIISDKTDSEQHGTRVAILPQALCLQLQHYTEHLRAMLPGLALLAPGLHDKLKALLSGEDREAPLPYLFLLDDKLSVQRIRPATLKPYLKHAGWTLPTNSNRHYLRTKMREAGASGEEVSILLGHWLLGQEPYGLFSTQGLDAIERRVSPMLDTLLDACGCQAMPGLA
jgi:hypothetical protein